MLLPALGIGVNAAILTLLNSVVVLRVALGAFTFRQLRQHLTESLMLASKGCLLGVAIAGAIAFGLTTAPQSRSLQKLTSVNSGLDPSDLFTMRVNLLDTKHKKRAEVIQQSGYNGDIQVPGLPTPPASFVVEFRWIAADYLRATGIPLVRGRGFTPEEASGKRGEATDPRESLVGSA